MRPHALSVAVFAAQLCGYVALSTALQRRYYHRRGAAAAAWRSQPAAPPHAPDGQGLQARACRALRCRVRSALAQLRSHELRILTTPRVPLAVGLGAACA